MILGGRRARPHAERQQQRLLPGQRADLAQLGAGPGHSGVPRLRAAVTQLWREQPVLQRRTFFQGRPIRGADVTDVSWFTPAGEELTDGDWKRRHQCLGVRLAGDLIGERGRARRAGHRRHAAGAVQRRHEAIPFTLPATNPDTSGSCCFDTADDARCRSDRFGGERYRLDGAFAGRCCGRNRWRTWDGGDAVAGRVDAQGRPQGPHSTLLQQCHPVSGMLVVRVSRRDCSR